MPGGGNQSGGGAERRAPRVLPDQRRGRVPQPALEPGGRSTATTPGKAPRRRCGGPTWRRAPRRPLAELNGLDGEQGVVPAHEHQPPRRHDAQLRAHGRAGGLGRLRLGHLHQPPALRQPGDQRPHGERSPRDYDANDYTQITCKKLWVAAVDIGSIKNGKFVQGWTPGTDPSHPAFYLPGAGAHGRQHARGFWVLDPCLANGAIVHDRRPVLRRLLRAQRRRGRAHLRASCHEQLLRPPGQVLRPPPTAATRAPSA